MTPGCYIVYKSPATIVKVGVKPDEMVDGRLMLAVVE